MKNGIENALMFLLLSLMLTPVGAQAKIPTVVGPIAKMPMKETYDDACCDALIEYVRCQNSDPSYEENLKSECSVLAKKYDSLSMDDFAELAKKHCGYYATSAEADAAVGKVHIDDLRIDQINAKDACAHLTPASGTMMDAEDKKDNRADQSDTDNFYH